MNIIEQTATRLVYSQQRKAIRSGVPMPNSQLWLTVAWWCSIVFSFTALTMYLTSPTFLNIIFVVIPILSTLICWILIARHPHAVNNFQSLLHVVFDLISDEVTITTTFNGKQSIFRDSLKQFCDVKIIPYSKFDLSQGYEIFLAYPQRAMRGIYRADTIEEANPISERVHNLIKDHLSPCPEVSKVSKES